MLGLTLLFTGITGFITLWHNFNLWVTIQPKLCQLKIC
jgi:hypothetical protein